MTPAATGIHDRAALQAGARKGAAFVFGWLVSLAIVVAVTVLATGNNPPQPATAPSLATLAVKTAIGVILVVIAIRHIRARGQPKPPKKGPKAPFAGRSAAVRFTSTGCLSTPRPPVKAATTTRVAETPRRTCPA